MTIFVAKKWKSKHTVLFFFKVNLHPIWSFANSCPLASFPYHMTATDWGGWRLAWSCWCYHMAVRCTWRKVLTALFWLHDWLVSLWLKGTMTIYDIVRIETYDPLMIDPDGVVWMSMTDDIMIIFFQRDLRKMVICNSAKEWRLVNFLISSFFLLFVLALKLA